MALLVIVEGGGEHMQGHCNILFTRLNFEIFLHKKFQF